MAEILTDVVNFLSCIEPFQTVSLPRIINLEEVAEHDTRKDCWIVIYDKVYDITDLIDTHKGGGEILLEYAGLDATSAFREVGHSNFVLKEMEKYFIGELPLNERIFRSRGRLNLNDVLP